jgi:antitoxin (DNA-binding transcriptional repressor) of toxin-antitoxin stability system
MEALTVTRDGQQVAELRPLGRQPLTAAVLIERWSNLPSVDVDRLRADIAAVIDDRL